MYTLNLANGTSIEHLTQIKPNTFIIESTDSSLYWQLSAENLSFATLVDEDDELLGEVLIDYARKNFYNNGQVIEFTLEGREEFA